MVQLLERSSDIKSKIVPMMKPGTKIDDSIMKQTISWIEQKSTALLDLKNESDAVCMQTRDHMIELYQRVGVGLLRKVHSKDGEMKKQEGDWQATVDKLIEAQQVRQHEKDKLDERIEGLTSDQNVLKAEHYNLQSSN